MSFDDIVMVGDDVAAHDAEVIRADRALVGGAGNLELEGCPVPYPSMMTISSLGTAGLSAIVNEVNWSAMVPLNENAPGG
jgi:hypothetical protein